MKSQLQLSKCDWLTAPISRNNRKKASWDCPVICRDGAEMTQRCKLPWIELSGGRNFHGFFAYRRLAFLFNSKRQRLNGNSWGWRFDHHETLGRLVLIVTWLCSIYKGKVSGFAIPYSCIFLKGTIEHKTVFFKLDNCKICVLQLSKFWLGNSFSFNKISQTF